MRNPIDFSEDRLDVSNPEILKRISEYYAKYSKDVKKRSMDDAAKLVADIKYFKGHDYEFIRNEIVDLAKKRFLDISDEEALKIITTDKVKKLRERLEEEDPSALKYRPDFDTEVEDTILTMSDIHKQEFLREFREDYYDKYIKEQEEFSSKKHALFNSMSQEELRRYVNLFYDLRVKQGYFTAKTDAIYTVSEELEAQPPRFLRESVSVFDAAYKIAKITDLNEEETKEQEEALTLTEKAASILHKAMVATVGSITGSATALAATYIFTGNADAATPAAIAGLPIGAAALIGITKIPNVLDHIGEKISVKQAEKTGWLTRLALENKAYFDFVNYEKEMEEKYTKIKIVDNRGSYGL